MLSNVTINPLLSENASLRDNIAHLQSEHQRSNRDIGPQVYMGTNGYVDLRWLWVGIAMSKKGLLYNTLTV